MSATEKRVGNKWNVVYETPCGGKITGVMRLVTWDEGLYAPELQPNANVASGRDKTPDVPLGGWLPMIDTLGTFASVQEFEQVMNKREGWSLVAP